MSKPRQVNLTFLTSYNIKELEHRGEPVILKASRMPFALCLPVVTPNAQLNESRARELGAGDETIQWLRDMLEGNDDRQ